MTLHLGSSTFSAKQSPTSTKGHVAALRDVMSNKLELKTPFHVGASCTSKLTTKFDQDQEKPMIGRVLDGPVSPEKYFQGISPPNYGAIQKTANTSSRPNSEDLRLPLLQANKTSSVLKPFLKGELRFKADEIDDSASIISSCLSTVGESSEIAAYSAVGERNRFADRTLKQLVENQFYDHNDIVNDKLRTESPAFGQSYAARKHEGSVHLFAENLLSKTFGGEEKIREYSQNIIPDTMTYPKSFDLESSHLLVKPKSPVPYTTATSSHYGTLRKRYTSVGTSSDSFMLKLGTSQPDIEQNEGFDKEKRQKRLSCEEAEDFFSKSISSKCAGERSAAEKSLEPEAGVTATVLHLFEPANKRELALKPGQRVKIIREVDSDWMEGQINESCGIFPKSYVLLDNPPDFSSKFRAIFSFEGRCDGELSLRKGEIVKMRRKVDSNWLEGSNRNGMIGIFPASYVEQLNELHVNGAASRKLNETDKLIKDNVCGLKPKVTSKVNQVQLHPTLEKSARILVQSVLQKQAKASMVVAKS